MKEIPSSPSHTQRAHLEALGFVCEETEDSNMAEWSGYGLRFALPASMTLDHRTAVSVVIHQATERGKTIQQKTARDALGIITGIKT
jgi:hypothetical protein